MQVGEQKGPGFKGGNNFLWGLFEKSREGIYMLIKVLDMGGQRLKRVLGRLQSWESYRLKKNQGPK